MVVVDKKKGGPKTSAGKAGASRNSIKHGLTSAKPTTSKEKELVQTYINELTSYYQPEIVTPTDPSIDQEQLTSQLKLFAELLNYRDTSRVAYQQYLSIQDLMIQGVTLPQWESDLMMWYQTALDRRLSTAMGELLHLQSRRAPKSS